MYLLCDDTAAAATRISLIQSVGVIVRALGARSVHLYRTTSLLLLKGSERGYKYMEQTDGHTTYFVIFTNFTY